MTETIYLPADVAEMPGLLRVRTSMHYSVGMENTSKGAGTATKATSVHQIIGTMAGQRAIIFHFTMKTGAPKSVAFDFYGPGERFNGAEYARIEDAAIASMIAAGESAATIKTFTHYLIPLH